MDVFNGENGNYYAQIMYSCLSNISVPLSSGIRKEEMSKLLIDCLPLLQLMCKCPAVHAFENPDASNSNDV